MLLVFAFLKFHTLMVDLKTTVNNSSELIKSYGCSISYSSILIIKSQSVLMLTFLIWMLYQSSNFRHVSQRCLFYITYCTFILCVCNYRL